MHIQDRTFCLPRDASPILLLPFENNSPRAAILATRNESRNTRYLLLRKDAVLVLTTTVLPADRFLLPSRRNTTESGSLRLPVRYCNRMTASVTGSENNTMRFNLLGETGAQSRL